MAAARAEAAWLAGKLEQCQEEARAGLDLALRPANPWDAGELACWLRRGGCPGGLPADVAEPSALWLAGDWHAAAQAWERLGCPFEQALALLDGAETALRTALALCERLGAELAAAIARRRLRSSGARGLPRGPRPTTRENPAGLTNRQLEILRLVAQGLRNAEIASQLSTSPKTIDHHVSAVLAKLGVGSRLHAVARAHQLGLVPK